MPTFRQIIGNSVSLSFDYSGDEIKAEYYPGHVTEEVVRVFQAVENIKEETAFDDMAAFNATLAKLIKSWNVTEDDGTTMYPLTAARIADLPLHFRGTMAAQIMQAFRPKA